MLVFRDCSVGIEKSGHLHEKTFSNVRQTGWGVHIVNVVCLGDPEAPVSLTLRQGMQGLGRLPSRLALGFGPCGRLGKPGQFGNPPGAEEIPSS